MLSVYTFLHTPRTHSKYFQIYTHVQTACVPPDLNLDVRTFA